MDESIRSALDSQTASLDQTLRLLPTLQVYLQVTRQIHRLAQVEQWVAETRKPRRHVCAGWPAKPRQTRSGR